MNIQVYFPEPTPPRSVPQNLFSTLDIEIDSLLDATKARERFSVDGSGLAVAVLDTGLRVTHKCFRGRVLEPHNFLLDPEGNSDDVEDTNGHGTNVAGIIAAGTSDERRGIAPRANIIPLKVIPAADIEPIFEALRWVYNNTERFNITVVNFSFGIPSINHIDDHLASRDFPELSRLLDMLLEKRVAVVVGAGNDYWQDQKEGMTIPAIFRQVISVGAVYDTSFGSRSYRDGAIANSTHADQITPYSQRLSKYTSPDCYTDVFSAGGQATSAGAGDDDDTSIREGTSQASPTVAGTILLLQQYYLRMKGVRPTISLLQDILRATSKWITDGDDEDDNVIHTNKKYPRINAFQSLSALHKAIQLGNV